MRLEICPTPSPLRITLGDPEPSRTSPGTSCRTVQLAPGAEGITQAAELLTAHTGRNAWWGGCEFSNGYRRAADLVTASAIVLDFDTVAGPKKRGEKKGRPRLDPATAAAATMAAQLGELPGHLFHTSPRGVRLVAFLPHAVVDFERPTSLFKRAAHGLAAEAVEAFDRLGLLAGPGDEGRTDRLAVDRSTFEAARAFYTPRAEVEDKETHEFQQRTADVVVMRTDALDLERLVDRAELFHDPAPVVQRVQRPKKKQDRTHDEVGPFADAVAAYRRDHAIDFSSRTCPTCGHNDCFSPLDGDPERWFCFSANHQQDSGGVGIPGSGGGTGHGDVLDIDSHEQGCTRADLLRRRGYLVGETAITKQAPTIPIRSFAEINAEICEAVREGLSSDRSRFVVASAGTGKSSTTLREVARLLVEASIRESASLLAERRERVVVFALPSRRDVAEKIATARTLAGSTFRVEALLGASGDEDSGTFCSQFADRQDRAELFKFGCKGCADERECRGTEGRHLNALNVAEKAWADADKGGQPALILTTHAALAAHAHSVPKSARIVCDDSSVGHGLVGEVHVPRDALAQRAEGLEKEDSDAARFLARLARRVLGDTAESLADCLENPPELPEIAHGFGFDLNWETIARRLVESHAAGMPTHVGADVRDKADTDKSAKIGVWVGNPQLRDRARAGRVLWLSVGSIPRMAAAVSADLVEILGRSGNAKTLCVSCRNWGANKPGSRTAELRSEQLATIAQDIHDLSGPKKDKHIAWKGRGGAQKYGGRVGAVLRQETKRRMGNPDWVEHYGAGHAAHDRLEGCDVLVVARTALAPETIQEQALAIGGALGIDPEALRPELERFWLAHNIGNAIGRGRLFTSEKPQLVLLFDRLPADAGIHIDAHVTLAELVEGLGLPDRDIYRRTDQEAREAINEERKAAADELDERVAQVLAEQPEASDAEVAAVLGVSKATVQRRVRHETTPTAVSIFYDRWSRFVASSVQPADLTDDLAVKWGLSRASAREAVRRVLARIAKAEATGDPVSDLAGVRGKAARRLADVLELLTKRAQLEQLVADIESAAEAVSATDREPIARILRMAEAGRYGAGAEVAQAVDALRILRGAG